MSSKVLLDTNVMLDLALARPEGFDAAAAIAEAVAYEEVVAYVCATSLKDLYYILSKAMGEKDARTYIKAVMDDFIICSVDYALCRQAADSDEPDFEDGLVRACAENARVDFIVTRRYGVCSIKGALNRSGRLCGAVSCRRIGIADQENSAVLCFLIGRGDRGRPYGG